MRLSMTSLANNSKGSNQFLEVVALFVITWCLFGVLPPTIEQFHLNTFKTGMYSISLWKVFSHSYSSSHSLFYTTLPSLTHVIKSGCFISAAPSYNSTSCFPFLQRCPWSLLNSIVFQMKHLYLKLKNQH